MKLKKVVNIATADQLKDDVARRHTGDFYTPLPWVKAAHAALTDALGADWRKRYIVWDCCCGTGNLTRGYDFEALYSSTLLQEDLELANAGEGALQGITFQYDFLNDDVLLFEDIALRCKLENRKPCIADFEGTKLMQQAQGLVQSLCDGKPLLFFINPPYGTANNLKVVLSGATQSKNEMAKTACNNLMIKDKLGAAAQQLYAQFIWRICRIAELFSGDVVLGMFSPTLFITGSSFKGLRRVMQHLSFKQGFMLQASEFADVAGNWGIAFTVFGKTAESTHLGEVELSVMQREGKEIRSTAEKCLYNVDNAVSCSAWCKTTKPVELVDFVPMTSAIAYAESSKYGSYAKGALGYYYNISNIVEKSNQNVFIVSSGCASGHGYQIMPENFKRICATFTTRRLITGRYSDWINWQDEFIAPNTEHKDYKRFEADSVVYSLFNSKSNQAALRGVLHNGKLWDIRNEFFWLSADRVKALAQAAGNADVEQDILTCADERYVYKLLSMGMPLSDTAKAVLQMAEALLTDSFTYRQAFDAEHKDYCINTWDAGWYQIKGVLKTYMPDELKAFNELYAKFSDELRPMVYDLGFLRR